MSDKPRHASPQPVAWLTPARRAWLYRVVLAAVPLLIAYGVLDKSQAPLWVALVTSMLGTGTALVHTPDNAEEGDHV